MVIQEINIYFKRQVATVTNREGDLSLRKHMSAKLISSVQVTCQIASESRGNDPVPVCLQVKQPVRAQ